MDAEYEKGERLLVETIFGTLDGIFHSMGSGHNRLTLTEVVLHTSGRKMEGFSHYYKNEVISVRNLGPDSGAGVSTKNEASGNHNLMRKGEQAVQPGKVKESDVMNTESGHTVDCTELSEEKDDELNKLDKKYVLIDSVGRTFRKAVEDIKAEPAVGFSMEGAMFGRFSQPSLATFATPSCVFLFDIYTLGDAAFDNGLRDILESEKIEKVIHNCRFVCDCLHHKYKVSMSGVFDTQVADLKVIQQQCGHFPRYVRSLSHCLSIYLHLPKDLIYHPQIREGYIYSDSEKWNIRPMLVELEEGAVKNVGFLLQLREKVCEELLLPFYQCVDVFLGTVRDSGDPMSSEHLANDTKVPWELLSLNDEP